MENVFVKRVKDLRIERGLTQDELSIKTGISRTTITRYESGDRPNPGRDALVKLANFFNVSIDYLVGDTDIRQEISNHQLINMFSRLNDSNKVKAILYINELLNQEINNENN